MLGPQADLGQAGMSVPRRAARDKRLRISAEIRRKLCKHLHIDYGCFPRETVAVRLSSDTLESRLGPPPTSSLAVRKRK